MIHLIGKDFAFSNIDISHPENKHKFEAIPISRDKSNQRTLLSNHIMKILIFKVLPIVIGLLLSQVQACKSTHPRGCYLKVKKAKAEAKAKKEAARAKEKELSRKLLEEK